MFSYAIDVCRHFAPVRLVAVLQVAPRDLKLRILDSIIVSDDVN